ncbi:MAG: preprotein translocase subunit YajC [Bacteroidota bacterium]|nr:preprotein translocase subunit YajC [Bacteroidota bacterium]MDP4225696.1 preprotein translocase subunit YajC [Bacteroidota bacterium]MDP4273530.1 preprotein translocase subunit YajC [Bacteroidota bacterium]
MNILSILLQAPSGGTNSLVTLLPLLLIIVIFYFFMIRPQVKRQKELRNYRNELKNGDKVITTGGIYGKIVEVSDQTVIIQVEDQVRLKVDKAAILKDPSDLATQR